jgi:hypothetical protein
MVSFVLRKFNNKWLIIDVLYVEKSDILKDSKLIEGEMKKTLSRERKSEETNDGCRF